MKLLSLLLSSRAALVLLLVLAVSMGVATFVENDHGTAAARSLVYDAWWFEVVMIWLALIFLNQLGRFRLLHKPKWPIGLFHIAFILILLGAGVTRYFSNEGIIHIREGQIQSQFYSNAKYLQIRQVGDKQALRFEKPVTLAGGRFKPRTEAVSINSSDFKVVFEQYIAGAEIDYQPGDETYVALSVVLGQGGREDVTLRYGETLPRGGIATGGDAGPGYPIRLFKTDTAWAIYSAVHLQVMDMATQQIGVLHAGETQALRLRSLYQWDGGAFVVGAIHENTRLRYIAAGDEAEAKNLPDMVHYKVLGPDGAQLAEHFVPMVSFQPPWQAFSHEGKNYAVTYGPKPMELPFALELERFVLERYPGSQSPSSYASEVWVRDGDNNFAYRIFMNNVLDYRGYRFYQSSYDTDEMGTVLSINQDRPGTYLTYLGYFLLGLGMFLAFFARGGRLRELNEALKKLRPAASTAGILLLSFLNLQAAEPPAREIVVTPLEIADAYGKLIVQDLDGRMKPLNTLANEITRKLNGRSKLRLPATDGEVILTPEQFMLALQLDPAGFSYMPLLKVDEKKCLPVFDAIGKTPRPRLAFQDLLDENGTYLLSEMVEQANRLKPAERNDGHKELLKLDERFNIFFALISGDFLRIFPNKLDANNTWFTAGQYQMGFDEADARFVQNITGIFLTGIEHGIATGEWKDAAEPLEYMHLFQEHAGAAVYPSQKAVAAELLYNKLNIGNRLFGWFWLLGAVLMALAIAAIFRRSSATELAWRAGRWAAWAGWALFTFHLALRWYIAGRPPWTDGFEMLVFVAWGVLLFGLAFESKSRFTLPAGMLFSGTLLFVSFLDWLNPEITNLMPVLHSYWLKIHVAVIVSGYAPLALAAILALLTLTMIALQPRSPDVKWYHSLQELTIVNEMAIMIGLFLLTVGTFLGGVWANESWGRYWAWDPKETWALISILVYAVVLHLRLLPALRSVLIYNLAALWGFSSIIMTSFGVNYYLSGLHSYAKGDPVPVPQWVYWATGILAIVSVAAMVRYRKLKWPEEGEP